MTHDEMLEKITGYQPFLYSLQPLETAQHIGRIENNALRAVVELHKDNGYGSCDICADPNTGHLGVMALYPCPTIQAIEKELR